MTTGNTRAFKAREIYPCGVCGQNILVGQYYRWNRKPKPADMYWHDNCDDPDAIPSYLIQDGKAQYTMGKTATSYPMPQPAPVTKPAPTALEPDYTYPPDVDSEPQPESNPNLEEMSIEEVKLRIQALELERKEQDKHKASVIQHEKTKLALRQAIPTPVSSAAIPYKPLPDNAAWPDILAQVARILKRILVVGPPGTGKSETIRRTLGIKYRSTMTPNMEKEMLLGSFILKDGETKHQDGPVTLAMLEGTFWQSDEWDRQGIETESLCYEIMDDAPHLGLIDGRTIHATAGFGVIGTTNNPNPMLEDAVLDRIDAVIMAYEPHEAIIKSLTVPGAAKACKNYYASVKRPDASSNLCKRAPTARRWRAFQQLLDGKMNPNIAVKVVFGSNAAPEVMSVLSNLIEQSKKKDGDK